MSHQILLGGFLQSDPNGDPTEVYTLSVDGQMEPERSREFVVHVRLADRTLRLTLERGDSGWCCRVTLPDDAQVQIDRADPPMQIKKPFERPMVMRMPPGWTPADGLGTQFEAKPPIDPSVDFILNGPGEELIPPGETLESAMARLDEVLGGELFKDTLRKP